MILLVALLVLCCVSSACGGTSDWTLADTLLESAFAVTMLMDHNQTEGMMAHSSNYEEVGWARAVIGPHPSEGEIHSYFLVTTVLHAGIAYLLPQPYRVGWQLIGISVEVNTIHANQHEMNAKLSIRF